MAINREKIQPQGMHVRIMAGQPAYSQIVTVSGTGRQIFVAGQLARDPQGNCVGKGDMRAEIQQVCENIKACLEAAGATLADIVKTNTYVTDFEEFSKHGEVRMRYFGPATPTSTTVEVPPRRPRFHGRDRGDRLRRQLTRGCPSLSLSRSPGRHGLSSLEGVAVMLTRANTSKAIINDSVMVNSRMRHRRPLISPRFKHNRPRGRHDFEFCPAVRAPPRRCSVCRRSQRCGGRDAGS
jgi:2-iminobutanoate/2-iminopropanoate deaminase